MQSLFKKACMIDPCETAFRNLDKEAQPTTASLFQIPDGVTKQRTVQAFGVSLYSAHEQVETAGKVSGGSPLRDRRTSEKILASSRCFRKTCLRKTKSCQATCTLAIAFSWCCELRLHSDKLSHSPGGDV